jgi:hypothetical protein
VPARSGPGLTETVKVAGVVPLTGVIESQLPVDEALALTGMAPPLLTVKVWEPGAGVGVPAGPCWVVKLSEDEVGSKAVVTVSVAGIFSVWLIVIVAVYMPGVRLPSNGSNCALSWFGVDPLSGVTTSQLPPPPLKVTATLKLAGEGVDVSRIF